MTFDDWMLTKDKSYVPTDDSMNLRLLRECWFSRDAEVADLQNKLGQRFSDYNTFEQMRANEFRLGRQSRDAEITQLREQVTLLEAEVARLNKGWYEANGVILEKALAATEPAP